MKKPVHHPHLLIAGGGSGGHVFPALAVAEILVERGWRATWVGAPGSVEERLVPGHGLAFRALPARPWLGRSWWRRVSTLVTLAGSALRVLAWVIRDPVAAALGSGGFVSVPALLGARLAGRPLVLLEPNAAPGKANRALSRLARGACTGWEGPTPGLACATWPTGVPVRAAFFAADASVEPEPDGPLCILVLGGSQGSRLLNHLVPGAVAGLQDAWRVIHQCGRGREAEAEQAWAAAGASRDRVEILAFLDDMAGAMRAADVIVSRAGAITLAEIQAVGRAAVLVPLLEAAESHQLDNARRLEAAGAGLCLGPGQQDETGLRGALGSLVGDPERRRGLARAAAALARPDAATAIADRVEAVAGRRAA